MTEEEQDLWSILDNVNTWIRFADAKAGATIAVTGAIASLATGGAVKPDGSPFLLTLAGLSVTAAAVAVFYALSALLPQLAPDESVDTTLYFGHIAKYDSSAEYLAAVRATREGGSLATEVAHQIRQNARIAAHKFSMVEKAMQAAAAQLIVAFVLLTVRVLGSF